MIFIETKHLILRNYKVTDFEDIFKYFSNEDVSKYEDFYPMKDEQVKDIINEWKEMDNRLVAELKSQNIVIGSIGYWIDDKNGKPILINTYLYELKKSDCKFYI